MKKIKIVFIPFELKFNKYVDLMKNAYENFADVRKLSVFNFFFCKYFAINWYESRNTLKFLIFISLLTLTNKKIIWTMHNKTPHELKYKNLSNLKMKIMLNCSYRIIIHSKESENVINGIINSEKIRKKIIYAPLPNFIGVYGDISENKTPKNKLKLLFLGLVKPYKNIELLVEAFNELNLDNAELKICGFAKENYKKELLSKYNDSKNVEFCLKFIPDNGLSEIFAQNHILICPYNNSSVLNSASVILAFSYKRTILSTDIATLNDFENKKLFFSYEYSNRNEHKKILKEKILFLYENYSDDYNKILDLGEKCFEAVKENNNSEKISKILEKSFDKDVK